MPDREGAVKQVGTDRRTAVYAYDGLTRRITKTIDSTTRHFYYSDRWQVLEERLGTSTDADRQFVWGLRHLDDLVVRDWASGSPPRLYALQDALSVTAVVNTSGAVQERYGYDAFGTCRFLDDSFFPSTPSHEWETLFHCYRWDAETALNQVRYRYSHPGLGRWVSRDHVSSESFTNYFLFCLNSSLSFFDPLGTEPPASIAQTLAVIPDTIKVPCNDDKIRQGAKILREAFAKAVERMEQKYNKPKPSPPGSTPFTCKTTSNVLVSHLFPLPPCWLCFQERSKQKATDPGDHEAIVCIAFGSKDATLAGHEILLDWWGQNYVDDNGKKPFLFTTPADFRAKMPVEAGITPYRWVTKDNGDTYYLGLKTEEPPPKPSWEAIESAILDARRK